MLRRFLLCAAVPASLAYNVGAMTRFGAVRPPLMVQHASAAAALAPAAHRAHSRMMCDEAAGAEPSPYDYLDVRVGQIVEAWEHPDSDKLWVEKIDVGEPEPRQIASGLRAYYGTAGELEGRKVIVVCNLKEAKLGGVASNGMVLCASSEDRSTVAFVEPPDAAAPGDRVLAEGAAAIDPATPNQCKKKKARSRTPLPHRRPRPDPGASLLPTARPPAPGPPPAHPTPRSLRSG